MEVIHILNNGTIVDDIKDHVVRFEDATPLYNLIDNINNSERATSREVQ